VLSAILHKSKLRLTEDALTAAFFDALRIHARTATLLRLLGSARSLSGAAPSLPPCASFRLEFWPDTEEGEPDARVLLLDERQQGVGALLVEAKLGAPKSGVDDDEDEEASPDGIKDQLARYLRAEVDARPAHPVLGIVYLTHHAGLPRTDLEESARSLTRHARPELAGLLFWLGWRDVEDLLAIEAAPDTPWGRHAADVVAALRFAGLFRFRGLHRHLTRPLGDRWRFAAATTSAIATWQWPSPPGVLPRSARWRYQEPVRYRWPRGVTSSTSPYRYRTERRTE
jgi:hypothetical protein